MGGSGKFVDRMRSRRAKGALAIGLPLAVALAATQFPLDKVSADAGNALVELAARSPGARVGGVALKAKAPRTARLSPVAQRATPGTKPRAQVAAVPAFAAPAASPANAVPGTPVLVLPDFGPAAVAATPAGAPLAYSGGVGGVGGGGGFIVGGGGSGGGGGASPGVPGTTPPGDGSTVVPPVVTPTTPPVSAVPEPSVWLMMILGFGAVGVSLRRRSRALALG